METTEILYTCRICGEHKPADQFEKDKRNVSKITGRCKACRCKIRRVNGEYLKERLRKYEYRNDHQLLMTVEDVERLMRRRQCSYCGEEMAGKNGEKSEATVDHVYALGQYGGSNIAENITGGCRGCNSAKGNKHIFDFYQASEKFTDELWTQFVRDFTENLIKRKLTDEEVEQMKLNFEVEARDLRGK